MKNVTVFLFSEMTDEDTIIPTMYTITSEELESLHYAVENNLTLIPFGSTFHHSDDIVKFMITDTDEQQYKNF